MSVKAGHVRRWTRRRAFAPAVTVLAASLLCIVAGSSRVKASDSAGAARFPNVTLTTQDGVDVRFYDDLLKGKIVAINLIYTTCQYACPLETARMAQVQRVLADHMGKDIFFYSITIDPEHDTPSVLKQYAEKYHAGPGWLFLTGKQSDIELISRKMGLYSPPDPANADGHQPYLLVGNEATGQWMRNSATDNPNFLARTIRDWMSSWQKTTNEGLKSYAEVTPIVKFDPGEYTFANHCAACHSIGRGDKLGPDLLGVSARREREWLTRFITMPDRVRADGDPIALSLRAKYREVVMPRLDLNAADASLLIDYIDRQSRGADDAAKPLAAAAAAAVPAATDLTSIVGPYLRIQKALNLDGLDGVGADAHSIAAQAAKLGAQGAPLQTAAGDLERAADLKTARAAFASLGDAVMIYAKDSGSSIGAEVRIAYCPMVQKYWLQTGDAIRNPFYGKSMSDCGRLAPDLPDLKK